MGGCLTGQGRISGVSSMLRSVICTCPPNLENRIISLTYADALLYKVSSLLFPRIILNNWVIIDTAMTYADLRLRILC